MEINYKYIALGILVGYLLPYIMELMQNKKNTFGSTSQKQTNEY